MKLTLCIIVVGSICIISLIGCMGTQHFTDPTRTAVEQLLIRTAADRASKELVLK